MNKASERRIILGVDDSPSGLTALQWAVSQARRDEAQLVAVRSWALGLPRHGGRHHRHLAHPRVVLFFNGAEQRDASAKLVRDAFRTATGGQPRDVTVTVRTPEGDPGAALTSIATHDGDMIVVGHEHMPGWRRAHRGSVSRYCRSHAGCPVVVVPTDQESL
jgi:nucleotide-binding universal stress UspA family protein